MTASFWTQDRIEALRLALLEVPEWLDASKYFTGSIRLCDEEAFALLDIRDGQIAIYRNSALNADLVVKGPSSDWSRVAKGELDWFQATTAGFGALTVDGPPVFMMRNIKILWLAFKAIAQTSAKHRLWVVI